MMERIDWHESGTPGPWLADGPAHNQIIWSDDEDRVCFMAHSNGLNDAKDFANARAIAEVPAMVAALRILATTKAQNPLADEIRAILARIDQVQP